jgi:PPK2 family polyphosphate:nucleotide phosphotransferase
VTTTKTGYWVADPAETLRASDAFVLAGSETNAHPGFYGSKSDGARALAEGAALLAELQELLFASSVGGAEKSILLVLQAMDSAGKGGIVGHVVGAVNPMGVKYTAFKKPTPEELEHDFLWRVRPRTPEHGVIAVFDRSHYEDVLIGRVRQLADEEELERRYGAINDFERELTERGTTIIKVMLNLGRGEQKKRLAERLDRPEKHWKYNPADVDERAFWREYQQAYQLVLDKTSTTYAPWHVVPADRKWYSRLAVQQLLIDALEAMDLSWPLADYDVEAEKARLAAS